MYQDENAPRVASLEGLAVGTTVAAFGLGAGTVTAAVVTGFSGLTVFLAILFMASLLGSAAYVGARRTSASVLAEGEAQRVIAHGAGRGGHGFLGAHVVALTDKALLSTSVAPWRPGQVATVLPLSEVKSVDNESPSSLSVRGSQGVITLEACPPPEVELLADEVRKRLSGDP